MLISGETSSSIILEVHDKKCIDVDIIGNDNIVINVSSDIYSSLAYIEDPFIIDELANDLWLIANQAANHRNRLAKMLIKKRERSIVSNVMEEMTVSEKLNYTFKVLNPICEGSLIKTEDSYAYNSEKYEKPLALSNISTGLKTFLILKTLLLNGSIDEGGTIILDEPEIHLHPQWQLLFAELIVLMQKEFGVHILLNTHSPYF